MSDPKAKYAGIRFEPVAPASQRNNALLVLIAGVIWPAATLAFELATHMCAEALFDPIPTPWHVAAIATVPAVNAILWLRLTGRIAWPSPRLAAGLTGAAIAISAFYVLLFAPILPLAVVAILAYGLGLLPIAPVAGLLASIALHLRLRRASRTAAGRKPLLTGLAAGLAVVLLLDIPPAATRLGVQWAASGDNDRRERGVSLLRSLGDEELLRRLCYDTVGRPTGLLSALVLTGGSLFRDGRPRSIAVAPAEIREIYYRVYGEPFNAKPAPVQRGRWSAFGDFDWDADHGATQVGGRIKGLTLASSRIDGSISGDDATAYLEWTVEFRNVSAIDREARLDMLLPPGGVVSRATLWVNGEEREAAYATRSAARAAYQRVAVQQRRDPLLVTTKGADRILAQAFPVPRNGGTIKFKIGMTAPVELASIERGRLVLPAIANRNFSFPEGVTHAVWIESKRPLTVSAGGLASSSVGGTFRVEGTLADEAVSGRRLVVHIERDPLATQRAARIGDSATIVQTVAPASASIPQALMLVIDGSKGARSVVRGLKSALDAIPPGTRVAAVLAAGHLGFVPLEPWSADHKKKVEALISNAPLTGGEDNSPALAEGLRALSGEDNAVLLWIHGAQPVKFHATAGRLEQALSRLTRLPKLVLYGSPGPNELLPDVPWSWAARTVPSVGSAETDLRNVFRDLTGMAAHPAIDRSVVTDAPVGVTRGSEHIVRLWGRSEVLRLMGSDAIRNRDDAVKLAADLRLVTPVSGAVVLETQQQYDASNLTPVTPATVPTVPEPHEWALIIVACLSLTWMSWRRRQASARAA